MSRPMMTSAAAALLRLLLQRAGAQSHRILLSDWTSVDWQSLTFVGERHRASFVVSGAEAGTLAADFTRGLEDHEFALPRGFVAEIGLAAPPSACKDGAMLVEIEALTLAD